MASKLDYIVERIGELNKLHGKKIRKNLKKFDQEYFDRADVFLSKYDSILKKEDKTIDYSIDCYLEMVNDMYYEGVQFMRSGEYSNKSFDEVNARVYNNPKIMEYFMHGLLLSQFLWDHHYDILLYFIDVIKNNKSDIKNYLEVGGGHGLYISEAINIIGEGTSFDLADISPSSIDLAKKMVANDIVTYFLTDIYEYNPTQKYDFITMGEVLEHVEDPVQLLKKLHDLLSDNGKVFITTPTNAPTIDHIYLFRNAEEIREVIDKAGFKVEKDNCKYSEDMPQEMLDRFKISMMYMGVLVKK